MLNHPSLGGCPTPRKCHGPAEEVLSARYPFQEMERQKVEEREHEGGRIIRSLWEVAYGSSIKEKTSQTLMIVPSRETIDDGSFTIFLIAFMSYMYTRIKMIKFALLCDARALNEHASNLRTFLTEFVYIQVRNLCLFKVYYLAVRGISPLGINIELKK